MDFSLIAAQWKLGLIPPEQVPALAIEMMADGFDSPGVVALAILDRPTSADLEPLMERAAAELNLPELTQTAALWRVAYATAEDIVSGAIPPRQGAGILWDICNELEMPMLLRSFVYLAADYGEGPGDAATEAAWFDNRIRESAHELLQAMPPDRQSAPANAA